MSLLALLTQHSITRSETSNTSAAFAISTARFEEGNLIRDNKSPAVCLCFLFVYCFYTWIVLKVLSYFSTLFLVIFLPRILIVISVLVHKLCFAQHVYFSIKIAEYFRYFSLCQNLFRCKYKLVVLSKKIGNNSASPRKYNSK